MSRWHTLLQTLQHDCGPVHIVQNVQNTEIGRSFEQYEQYEQTEQDTRKINNLNDAMRRGIMSLMFEWDERVAKKICPSCPAEQAELEVWHEMGLDAVFFTTPLCVNTMGCHKQVRNLPNDFDNSRGSL